MNWYRFDWASFITDEVQSDLAHAANLAHASLPEPARRALARLFEITGGLPIATRTLGVATRTTIARQLLGEALSHVFEVGRSVSLPGYMLEPVDGGKATAIRATPRILVNGASARELADLPRVSPGLASRIVEVRRVRPFVNVADLAERIDGLSIATARALAPRLSFALPARPAMAPLGTDLRANLRRLIELQPGDAPPERLMVALESLTVRCRVEPHPEAASARIRDFAAPIPLATTPVDRVEVLAGSRYYTRLTRLIGQARKRVDVCMFHIALPSAKHPTARLLDALAGARERGVRVRVLVDRDRRQDPYLSTVINRPAVERLRRGRVLVRLDQRDTLLHSKFVLVDNRVSVIGSHNWTAGSYFSFDDLSLLVTSADVCRIQRGRFNRLWRHAEVPARPRRGRAR